MPICSPRGCGCAFTSESLSIYPDESNINLMHIEMADPSVITEMQDDITDLEAAAAALAGETAALEVLVPDSLGSYTPVLTGATTNPALGSTGSTIGRYVRAGRFLLVQNYFAFGGSGIAQGSGQARISLPASPLAGTISGAVPLGIVTIRDTGASQSRDFKAFVSGGLVLFSVIQTTAFGSMTALSWESLGITFADTDLITMNLTMYIP